MIELYYEDINKFYSLEPSDDDYITYLWQSLVKEPFNKDTYKQYDQGEKIYSKIVNDIKDNVVDKEALCLDPKFISFLKTKYEEHVYKLYYEEQIEFTDMLLSSMSYYN